MSLGPSFPIVIQSGLSAGTPSTVGNLPQFSGVAPPNILINSLLRQAAPGGVQTVIVGATDPAFSGTAVETFRTRGGIISRGAAFASVVLGEGAVVGAGSNGPISIGDGSQQAIVGSDALGSSIVIGRNSSLSSATAPAGNYVSGNESNVIIGPNITVSSFVGAQPNPNQIVIGAANSVTNAVGGTSQRNIAIGHGIALAAANNCTIIGGTFSGSTQLGNCNSFGTNNAHAATSVGNLLLGNLINMQSGGSNAICIGNSIACTAGVGVDAIAIGRSVTIESDFAIMIGATARARGTASITIGRGADSGAFTDTVVVGSLALANANNQVVIGGPGTGGDFREFVLGNRGPFANVVADVRWRMSNADTALGANTAAGTLSIQAGLGLGNVTTGGEIQFFTGAPGGSGSVTQTATKQFSVLKSAGGAAAPNTAWDNVTTGAAAAAGTLLNAPSAGNPSFWLPVRINGAVRYIPCWT